MDYYRFRIDVEKIRPLLQRDLYKNPNTALREIVQNSMDAITRRAKKDPAFSPIRNGQIIINYDGAAGTLRASDNGVGLSKTALIDTFRYYGRSDKGADEIGTFGLGAKSIFAVADSFTIHTHSMEDGATHLVYVTLEGLAFQPNPPPRDDYGTTLTIPTEKLKNPTEITLGLSNFCRCVQLPVYVERSGSKDLVSQQTPFTQPSFRVQGDGFEVHLDSQDHTWRDRRVALYVEGIFVCDLTVDNMARIAINVTRKDAIDLTMGRDSPIENEKLKTLTREIEDTIVDFVNTKLKFTHRSIERGEWKAAKWVREMQRGNEAIVKRFNAQKLTTIEVLCTDAYYYKKPPDHWTRPTGSSTLVEVLVRTVLANNKVYYAFRPLRDVAGAVGNDANMAVVYNYNRKCQATREEVIGWLEKFNIKELTVLTRMPRKRILHTPTRTTTVDLTTTEWHTSRIVIFPWRTDMSILKTAAQELRCSTIKLHDHEALKEDDKLPPPLDLRTDEAPIDVILMGQQRTMKNADMTTLTSRDPEISPVEYFRLATAAPQSPIIFPKDLRSACVLLMNRAKMATIGHLNTVLEAGLPKDVYTELHKVKYWRENLAQTIAAFDWNEKNSRVLFQLIKNDYELHNKLLAMAQNGECKL